MTRVRWRYRTAVLVGPWRGSAKEAAEDAVVGGQAERDPSRPHGLRWRLPGTIERDPLTPPPIRPTAEPAGEEDQNRGTSNRQRASRRTAEKGKNG